MYAARPVLLYDGDPALLASLQFSLELEGFRVADGSARGSDPREAACMVIDQRFGSNGGLSFLADLRTAGCEGRAILLATNPTRRVRQAASDAGALLIEKPLLGEALTRALRSIVNDNEAA
ncbi:response regulator [Allosphingosinicella vermicomposti]|uniref:response regulator n=1 Tax=Allosphingosinicella vermicomposti TaxID=614671 RepID=UPI000D10B3B7|nr:response regulator [Allosphingosinicella vermicomposti]